MTTAAALAEENIEEMLKGITIPSPPQIIADLQLEMAMPDPDMATIARLITKDAALAGGVLKIANSPFYGMQSIGSIQQAVMMLGMNTVMNIVNAVQLREMSIFAEGMSDEMIMIFNKFWDSAEDVAKCCSLISRRLNYMDPELAYMLGLFHNAGIPLLLHKHKDYLSVLADSYQCHHGRTIDTENRVFNTNHAVIGYFVARSWKLPAIITQATAEHHNGIDIFSDKSDAAAEKVSYIAVLKMAEHITGLYNTLGNQQTDLEWQAIESKVLDCLGLSEPDFDDIIGEAHEQGIGGYTSPM